MSLMQSMLSWYVCLFFFVLASYSLIVAWKIRNTFLGLFVLRTIFVGLFSSCSSSRPEMVLNTVPRSVEHDTA